MSEFSEPIITLNTFTLELYLFSDKEKEFIPVSVIDVENLIPWIPKYFKFIVISDEEIIILGGSDRRSNKTSKEAYSITNNKISKILSMNEEWQYFSLCKSKDFVYVIGGYNITTGVLSSCERFSLKAWKWEELEDMSVQRMNSSSCSLGESYVYVFGGLGSTNEFHNTIERFNTELKIWTLLTIAMP